MPNNAPVSSPVSVNAAENGIIAIRVIFQDADLIDIHSLVLNTAEMVGSGTVVSDDTFHYNPGVAFDYLSPGETATDTFSYTVTDAEGESSTSTVTVTITGHNDAPVAAAVAVETDENTSLTILPSVTDPDQNDTHSFTVNTTGTVGSVTVNADGTFSYNPDGMFDHLGAGETATDTFTYTVTDAAGESSTETVTVTINGVDNNTSPDTFPYEFTTNEDKKIVFRTIFHDPDVGDTHTYSLNTADLIGTLTETGEGVFEYDPSVGFDYLAAGETATTTFTYTVTDSFGASDTDTVTITVTGRNDAPVASAMTVSTTESKPLVITPDFADPDKSDTHTFTVDTSSTTGTVTLNDDGTFTYDPNGKFDQLENGETATDSFTYTVTDNAGKSSTETISVTINGESDLENKPFKIIASDGEEADQFGADAQVNDHGVIVVGARTDDDKGENTGSVYVYTPDGDGYSETKLIASNGIAQNRFGEAVAINNSGVIVASAANRTNEDRTEGLIYVFTPREDGTYSETKLAAPDGAEADKFGRSLSINNNGVIVVSKQVLRDGNQNITIFTPDESGGYTAFQVPGSSYTGVSINDDGVVFLKGSDNFARILMPDGSGSYTELQLTTPDSGYGFGRTGVVTNDGSIVIANPKPDHFNEPDKDEAVYIFKPDGNGNYSYSKILGIEHVNYGKEVAVNSAGVIVATAMWYDATPGSNNTAFHGAVFVYVPDGSGGYSEIMLTAYDIASRKYFGSSISINEDGVITVGATGDDNNGKAAGAVYVFTPDADGNYVGADGTVYEPTGPAEMETFDTAPLKIIGSDAAEDLKGGDGNDTITGNGGDDILRGGEGKDTFVFNTEDTGHDTIKDFAAGTEGADVIEFATSLFADFDAVIAAAEQDGANTVITLDAGNSITLEGVTLSNLHQDDFAFIG